MGSLCELTCFYDKAQIEKGGKKPVKQIYIPSWSTILGPSSTKTYGYWKLHYNVLDLEIGRNYFISRKIALRPHVGLRGVWIDLDYTANYASEWTFQTLPAATAISLAANTAFKATNDFEGIGVRSGGDLMWHFSDISASAQNSLQRFFTDALM